MDDVAVQPWPFEGMEDLAREAECHETPEWAAEAILRVELMTSLVADPGCGRGVLAKAAKDARYAVNAFDLHDWGYGYRADFLATDYSGGSWEHTTIFMNPPFSQAAAWVIHALDVLRVRKIVCFQRLAWWESVKRDAFWAEYTPQRIYVCAERATCWRVDIPPEKRGVPKSKGGAGTSTPTAHAWFVWERGQPSGPIMGRLHRDKETNDVG